jgi:hypothetical protein
VPDGQDVQTVERHVAVVSLSDVVGEHPVTDVVGRRLGKLTWARNVATADVEPVACGTPLRNVRHDTTLSFPFLNPACLV